ncbi:MAG: response regulator, partial [Candidatus Wallbacteria bacterium]|nr:response regulator [Candidatus Wallbacteria bacterium]
MKEQILIVEDSSTQAAFYRSAFEDESYRVVVASSGEAGLAAIRSAVPDLLLLDVRLPAMSGYQVCRTLRDDPATNC